MTIHTLSREISHFFHRASTIRPLVWIALYVGLMPLFALVYWLLPLAEWRVPEGAGTGYASWLYYSIVTITTLGFGDYTPAHGWAQVVTAVEVMSGVVLLGFFLNAVGSMKSEIDVDSAIARQNALNREEQHRRLAARAAPVLRQLHAFVGHCQKADTPDDVIIKSATRSALCVDALQNAVDISFWPDLLDDCFTFVANCQLFLASPDTEAQVSAFVSQNTPLAQRIETELTRHALPETQS